MCNHYRIEDPNAVQGFLTGFGVVNNLPSDFGRDAWPQYRMPIVRQIDGKLRADLLRWGCWPFFDSSGTKPKNGFVVNARDDKLLSSPLWRTNVQKRRCLVPADTWLEWTGPKGAKWEVAFRFNDRRPFWVAGLWSKDPIGDGEGFAMITSSANELVAALPHERMVVVLDEKGARSWIEPGEMNGSALSSLCRPYPSGNPSGGFLVSWRQKVSSIRPSSSRRNPARSPACIFTPGTSLTGISRIPFLAIATTPKHFEVAGGSVGLRCDLLILVFGEDWLVLPDDNGAAINQQRRRLHLSVNCEDS
jgi:putative SOS response-associated peptidase YedK